MPVTSSLSARTSRAAGFSGVPRRQTRTLAVRVQAFANDSSNGSKQSAAEISRLIGLHIKEAAEHMGTMRVWNFNAAVGKYVAQAAESAKASKAGKVAGSSSAQFPSSAANKPAASAAKK